MELICEKYKVKMAEAEAECLHLEEYCQFRTACIINFLTRERQREARHGAGPDRNGSASSKSNR